MLSTTCIPEKGVTVTRYARLKPRHTGDAAEVRLPPSCLNLCKRVSMLGEQHCCHYCISVLHRKIFVSLVLEETELVISVRNDACLVGGTEFPVVFLI